MAMSDYTRYQQGIIKRYYEHADHIHTQRLAELATELYLAEGKQKERLWKQAGVLMTRLGLPASRVEHILAKSDPALLPAVLKELEGRSG